MIAYIVCDRCGHYWGAPEADTPARCERCRHTALWVFATLASAADHSRLIRDRLRVSS